MHIHSHNDTLAASSVSGINFYNRKNSVPKAELDLMFKTARTQGLGYWMDYGLKVHIVDHTNCTYPPVDEKLSQYFDTVLK